MAESKRLAVITALTNLLKGITPGNGFAHDLSGAVFRGIATFGADDPIPLVSIIEWFDVNEPPAWVGKRDRYKHTLDLMVQGWAELVEPSVNFTDPAYALLADVQKRLALTMDERSPFYQLGGLATDVNVSAGMVRPDDRAAANPQFHLRIRIEVAEKLSDPYDLS